MDDRVWIYTGWNRRGDVTSDWIEKTEAFLNQAFSKLKGGKNTWCPYSRCGNTHRQTSFQSWIYERLYPVDLPW